MTLISQKQTLNFAELQSILAGSANIINDRPIRVQALSEADVLPPTNQLLLGKTSMVEEKENK